MSLNTVELTLTPHIAGYNSHRMTLNLGSALSIEKSWQTYLVWKKPAKYYGPKRISFVYHTAYNCMTGNRLKRYCLVRYLISERNYSDEILIFAHC
jgi:hypothetical protein